MIWAPRELPHIPCPCCGYKTIGEKGGYEICEICGWEDEHYEYSNPDRMSGGANGDYSLTEARKNFELSGSMYRDGDHRKPTNPEYIKVTWQLRKVMNEIEKTGMTEELLKEVIRLRKEQVEFLFRGSKGEP